MKGFKQDFVFDPGGKEPLEFIGWIGPGKVGR